MSEMRIPSVLTVKPSSAIRTDYKRFSELCHETDDPILVTNNGENDLVVMSHEAFCRREAWYRLQMKLAVADQQMAEGKMTDHEDVMARLEARINDPIHPAGDGCPRCNLCLHLSGQSGCSQEDASGLPNRD